jgi:hypothetical protein
MVHPSPVAGYQWLRRGFTDSAAGGSALATGVKTFNNAISVDNFGQPLSSVTEDAKRAGLSTRVVTSVPFSHATPAAFGANSVLRDDYHGIAHQMIFGYRLDVIAGAGNPTFDEAGRRREMLDFAWVSAEDWATLLAGSAPRALFQSTEKIAALAEGRLTAEERPRPDPDRRLAARAGDHPQVEGIPEQRAAHTPTLAERLQEQPMSLRSFAASAGLGLFLATGAVADEASDLALQLSNPIANLISVPFQLNCDEGYGARGATRTFVNIQPVIPFSLNADWNVISRTIVPVIGQGAFLPAGTAPNGLDATAFGLGDTAQSLFFSPKRPGPGGVTWGAGPVFLFPTTTENALGTGKWGIGPTGVVLRQTGPWTMGMLANHVWSFAGDDDRSDVSSTLLQAFLTNTTARATTYFLNTETTYDWDSEAWAVPVNVGINQLFTIGEQRIQVGDGLRYWLDAPDNGPEGWGARLNVVFLFPR